jgi:hypothetical protein
MDNSFLQFYVRLEKTHTFVGASWGLNEKMNTYLRKKGYKDLDC